MGESFTAHMRKATRNVHSISDKLVNSKLFLALSDEYVWADSLLIFYDVFKRLEEYRFEMVTPEFNMLYVDDALLRTEAFEKDLDRFLGPSWKKNHVPRPEVQRYLLHLEELKEERSLLLLAYVYHLYMGLLSGGQIIKKKRQVMKHKVVSLFSNLFYWRPKPGIDHVMEFPGADIRDLKRRMKAAMNAIARTLLQEERYALANESQMVFFNNNSIVRSVRGTSRAVIVKVLYTTMIVQGVIFGFLLIRSWLMSS